MTPEQERGIADLARTGRKIEAIKLCREATGMGLAEAKEYVESIESGGEMAPPRRSAAAPEGDPEIPGPVTEAILAGNKILAIKLYREARGASVGLAEAKQRVEQLEADLRARSPEKFSPVSQAKGCATMIAAVLLIAVASLWLFLK